MINETAQLIREQAASPFFIAVAHNTATVYARWHRCARPSNTTQTATRSVQPTVFARPRGVARSKKCGVYTRGERAKRKPIMGSGVEPLVGSRSRTPG